MGPGGLARSVQTPHHARDQQGDDERSTTVENGWMSAEGGKWHRAPTPGAPARAPARGACRTGCREGRAWRPGSRRSGPRSRGRTAAPGQGSARRSTRHNGGDPPACDRSAWTPAPRRRRAGVPRFGTQVFHGRTPCLENEHGGAAADSGTRAGALPCHWGNSLCRCGLSGEPRPGFRPRVGWCPTTAGGNERAAIGSGRLHPPRPFFQRLARNEDGVLHQEGNSRGFVAVRMIPTRLATAFAEGIRAWATTVAQPLVSSARSGAGRGRDVDQ